MMQRFLLAAATLISVVACNNEITGLEPPSDPATETFAASLGVDIAAMSQTTSGVYYSDIVVGTGTEVTATTDSATVTYAGFLKDGRLFDSGSNTVFALDENLIQGFRDGMIGMKVGGKRKLVIPSELGYGNRTRRDFSGGVSIPRQSTLVFDVEIANVVNLAP